MVLVVLWDLHSNTLPHFIFFLFRDSVWDFQCYFHDFSENLTRILHHLLKKSKEKRGFSYASKSLDKIHISKKQTHSGEQHCTPDC